MDRTAAERLLRFTFEQFKKVHTELEAYRLTFEALKSALKPNYRGFAVLADGSLAAARQSPALHEMMRKQFDEHLERFLGEIAQVVNEEELEKLLRTMPPSKFEN